MKLYICVDDTDDLTKATSTGKIADLILREVIQLGGTVEQGITRHQLLLHEDIAYTSHNSSMCMVADLEMTTVDQVRTVAEVVLAEHASKESDPGLCICRLDQLKKPDKLITYGKQAQKQIIEKKDAYRLAQEIGGTGLWEYGGTGIGVIGALAGVGLRLSGCDGTFRGGKGSQFAGQTFVAAQWKEKLAVEQVIDFHGNPLDDQVSISCDDQLKLALIDHKKTLIAAIKDGAYVACKKKDLYHGDKKISTWTTACPFFLKDNDSEECYSEDENACYNCLYRRWTADGYQCVR